MSDDELFSARFRREREASWRKTERALDTLQATSASAVDKRDAALALPALIRELHSSLSVARSISLDKPMIGYLEALASRASLILNDEQPPLGPQFRRFFTHLWPQTMRALGWDICVATAIFFFGAALSWMLFAADASWFTAFNGWGETRTPDASYDYLRSTLYASAQGETPFFAENPDFWGLTIFAAKLFSNNYYVALLALAGGLLFGGFTVFAMFFNGLHLGAITAVFFRADLGPDWIGWLSIHGVTELGAIFIAGGGGLLIGRTMIFAKDQSMAQALRAIGPQIAVVAMSMIVLLGLAALIEGYLRQIIEPMWARYALGWGLGALWLAYFTFAGRGRAGV